MPHITHHSMMGFFLHADVWKQPCSGPTVGKHCYARTLEIPIHGKHCCDPHKTPVPGIPHRSISPPAENRCRFIPCLRGSSEQYQFPWDWNHHLHLRAPLGQGWDLIRLDPLPAGGCWNFPTAMDGGWVGSVGSLPDSQEGVGMDGER